MTHYAVTNPTSGTVIQEYPVLSDEELTDAISCASHGQYVLANEMTLAKRIAAIRRLAALYRERAEELGCVLSREMGKPLAQAIGEANFSASIYDWFADHAEEYLADTPITLTGGEGTAFIRKDPLGVLLGVMPWNYPYYQISRFAGPNLLLGNSILLKPASQCPESALLTEELFKAAGFPAGAFTTILADIDQVGTVIADPRVRGVSVTGSERAGAAVAELAGRHLKKVVLELGGSDPFIVLSTSDIDAVVDHAVGTRAANSGQACNAAKRFLILDEYYEEFLQKFAEKFGNLPYGDPLDTTNRLGPLSSQSAAQSVQQQVERAIEQGAELVVGGRRDGAFFEPTVLTRVTPENDAYYEEFFGPVAQVYRVSSEQEAIKIANDTDFGLGSYVFSDDPEQAQRLADRLEVGMVFINGTDLEAPELPFGGVKNSGFGRELGMFSFDEFVNNKLIRIAK